ncbi:MAG TPA: YCF48-related protein [bacterium]|jgi:photosystem II stability/assembly factor-like uncharacterized protein
MIRQLSLCLILCCALSATALAYDWNLQNPWPSSHNLLDVDFIDANTGWAVGYYGEILKTEDGGATWISQRLPEAMWWFDVKFFDAQNGWVFGEGASGYPPGNAMRTTDGGATWTSHGCDGYRINSASFVTPDTGWAVSASTVFHTEDGGENWVSQATGDWGAYIDVTFVDARRGWACGVSESDSQIVVYRTDDGGLNWSQTGLPAGPSVSPTIFFLDSVNGWVGGTGYRGGTPVTNLYKTTDGGLTWEPRALAHDYDIDQIRFVDPQNGWITGSSALLHTTDGGTTWTLQSTEFYNNTAIDAIDPNTAWHVGQWGQIRKTTNGGASWATLDRGPHCIFRSVSFVSETEGWTVGDGALVHTADAGEHWQDVTMNPQAYYAKVAFIDAAHGWLGGYNRMARTTDGGQSWQETETGWNQYITGILPISSSELWVCSDMWYSNPDGDSTAIRHSTDGGLNWEIKYSGFGSGVSDICMTSSLDGWAVGSSGLVMHTTNGGADWNRVQLGSDVFHYADVDFPDPRHGWIVGLTTNRDSVWLGRTSDGGETWERLSLAMFGYISDLRRVTFTDSLHGWVLGSGFHPPERVFTTDDGGETWAPMTFAVGEYVDDMCIVNNSLGYLVGQNGVIMRWGAPTVNAASSKEVVQSFDLQAYPNPFNSCTRITFDLRRNGPATLRVLNVLGQEVARLTDGMQPAGRHEVLWNAAAVSSGIYFAVLTSGPTQIVNKMVLMK